MVMSVMMMVWFLLKWLQLVASQFEIDMWMHWGINIKILFVYILLYTFMCVCHFLLLNGMTLSKNVNFVIINHHPWFSSMELGRKILKNVDTPHVSMQ